MKFKILIGILIGLCCNGVAQGQAYHVQERQTLDSLQKLLKQAKSPERKDTLYDFLDKTYEKIALRHRYAGNLKDGEQVIRDAMNNALEGKHYKVYGTLHVNLGQLYREMGLIEQSLEILGTALRIQDTVQNPKTIAYIYNNLGSAYFDNKELDKAFEYFEKAAALRLDMGDPYVGDAYWNIAFSYKEVEDTANFHKFLIIAASHYEKMNDEYGEGSFHFASGTLFLSRNQYRRSKEAYEKALSPYKKLGFLDYVAWAYHGIARAYSGLGNPGKALAYADSSYRLSKEIHHAERIKQSALIMSNIMVQMGDFKGALDMYKEYVVLSDSIRNTSNERALIKTEFKYRYERQAAADSVKNAEEQRVKDAMLAEANALSAQQEAEIKAQTLQRALLFGGLILVALFALFISNRFRITRKQKRIIELQKTEVERQREIAETQKALAEHQKHLVEEKNQEILDSINYARRLQEAILPPKKLVKEYLPDSFILYMPKDIVAGDFYWMETKDDTIFFAAADCTGHGVPGAMVSFVCSNGLNKSLIEEGITRPAAILDRTRELVINRFGRSEEEVKDGMDISLAALSGRHLQWAGANNPLWIFNPNRSLWPANVIPFGDGIGGVELKADKQPIGKYASENPFTNHSIELEEGDTIYIFSDGFPDQFGGAQGKKYKSSKFKEFLSSIYHMDMDKQREALRIEFENWRGEIEQIDDVCVIGVRV